MHAVTTLLNLRIIKSIYPAGEYRFAQIFARSNQLQDYMVSQHRRLKSTFSQLRKPHILDLIVIHYSLT